MPRPIKKRQPHQSADRFYDYLMAHKSQVLRYITAALGTALIQFVMERLLPQEDALILLPQTLRFLLLFYLLKYWAYGEAGTGFFYTARQMMLSIMGVMFSTWLLYQAILLLATLFGGGALFGYIVKALLELFYFCFFQFFIFKQPKKD